MKKTEDKRLWWLEELGLDVNNDRKIEWVCDCPFCDDEKHLYLNSRSLLYNCKICNESGNYEQLMARLAIKLAKELHNDELVALAEDRQLPKAAFKNYDIGCTEDYCTLPVRDVHGKINNVLRYRPGGKLLGAPGCKMGLFGAQHLADSKRTAEPIYILEGSWDALAFEWLRKKVKKPGIVTAVLGAGQLPVGFVDYFRDRNVYIVQDNDDAGSKGEVRITDRLTGVARSMKYFSWGESDPDRADIRDLIIEECSSRKVQKNKFRSMWSNIHKRFSEKPELQLAESDIDRPRCLDYFYAGKYFKAAKLVEVVTQKFDPIIFAEGEFYQYSEQGLWVVVDSQKLMQFAALELCFKARAGYVIETIKLLSFTVFIDSEKFQQTSSHINLLNGMLEVKSGKLKKHSPEFNSRIQLPYSYEAKAKCPRWRKFLRQIFADDKGKIITLKQWFGYCLTTETFLQQFVIFKGSGGNGKSVVLSVLSELVGSLNMCAISLQKMENDFVLASLRDKLVNLCGEIKTSKLIDSETIKLLTGDDPITVDIKYKSAITFKPKAKHIFSTNELPKFRDKTQALRRRAVFLTFEQTFTGKNCNKNLTNELLEELPGILLWTLEGWKEPGDTKTLYESPSCLAYKDRFAETLNPVLAFVNQACTLKATLPRIKRSALYKKYRNWHLNNIGERPLSKPAFYERLRDDFPKIREVRVRGEDFFRGIKVGKRKKIKFKSLKQRGKVGKPKT